MNEPENVSETSRNAIYLLRTVQQHHVHLSAMADNKAGVLLGASFVSLTILGAWVSTGQVHYGAIAMGLSVLLTAFFSVLALIPRSGPGPGGRPGAVVRNPLFFGVFARMDYVEFEEEMMGILSDDREIYRAMLKDIYGMGVVQQEKKYKFIRYSYLSFLIGLVVSPLIALGEFLVKA